MTTFWSLYVTVLTLGTIFSLTWLLLSTSAGYGFLATVENLIENRHELKGKMKDKIEEHQEIARLSKLLATIVLDVPLVHTVNDCRLSIKMESAKEKLAELELNRVWTQLTKVVG